MRSLPIIVGAVLAACHADSGGVDGSAKHYHFTPPKGPTAQQQTRGMVDAAIVGNSSLAVNVKFDLKERPVLGQPVSIELALLPEIAGAPASVAVASDGGLRVPPENGNFDYPSIEAGQVYRQTVVVTPMAAGVLVLALNVTIHHDDLTESRAFSIPLIVDPLTQPTAAK